MMHEELNKLLEEAERWVPTFRLGSLETDLMNRLIQAVREIREEAQSNYDIGLKAPADALRDRDNEIARLKRGYQLSQFSSVGCPGCEYRDGVFIKHCVLHQEQVELEQRNDSLRINLEAAERERDELRAKLNTEEVYQNLLIQERNDARAKLERAKEALCTISKAEVDCLGACVHDTAKEALAAIDTGESD